MIYVSDERVFVPAVFPVESGLADSTRGFDSFYARN